MSDKQPEALRLADNLERMVRSTPWDRAAAAELLRLHAVNQELVEALQSISEYWNGDRNDTAMHDACEYAITVAQAALAKAQGDQDGTR